MSAAPRYNEVLWRKSARSAANGACVEFAELSTTTVAVRDSKDPTGPVLEFTAADWTRFIGFVTAQ
jgi:hypothetical protein